MPIRFRCAYCTQLMSIARRKGGTVVRCPKCAGEIIVPVPEGEQAPVGGQVFEDDNFNVNLQRADAAPPSSDVETAAGPQALTDLPGNLNDAPSSIAMPRRLGFFVPIGMLIISIGCIVLLLILMFVLGLIIGRNSTAQARILLDSAAPARATSGTPKLSLPT